MYINNADGYRYLASAVEMNTRRENKPADGSIESIPASRFPLHKRNGVLYCFDEPHLKSIIHSSLFFLFFSLKK